jgi:hypothetical protein
LSAPAADSQTIRTQVFSIGKLPEIGVDERFDLVTAFEIIYYVKDIPRALDMMDRLGAIGAS